MTPEFCQRHFAVSIGLDENFASNPQDVRRAQRYLEPGTWRAGGVSPQSLPILGRLMYPIWWLGLPSDLAARSADRVTHGGCIMDFPILELMDETTCYEELLDLLHPDGLTCPRCGGGRDRYDVHRRRDGSPVVDYRCRDCRRGFNLFTGTPWRGTHRTPARILLILRGFTKGTPTAELARELEASRPHLLELRHAQARAAAAADGAPLADDAVEADELYQNAGEKRRAAPRPAGPAAAAGQPGQGPRHLGDRPAAGLRGRGAEPRPADVAGGAAELGGGAGPWHRRAADSARGD